ncbi:hypothetical protein [Nostoc sp.]|uniref:hypothetical protein n=1 Tax=Nostoc sp. TaxID=1180 RepID=UPI002FF5977C
MDFKFWILDYPSEIYLWSLDSTVNFLNHGYFSACPKQVLEFQQRLRSHSLTVCFALVAVNIGLFAK